MDIKVADWVTCKGSTVVGCVKRVAKDGSWVDVDWGTYVKRMQKPSVLEVQHTISLGDGVTVTDMNRESELKSAKKKTA